MSNSSEKWYKNPIWVLALLVLFFPVGLYLMWVYMPWNKSLKWIVTGLILILIPIGAINDNRRVASSNAVNTTVKQNEVKSPETSSTPQMPTATVAQVELTYQVTKVIDGDTIEISTSEGIKRVRYIGIDTPETVDPRKTVQCFGNEASVKNKELVEGKRVKLEKDISETDKYGRLLRYVWVGNVFVNDYLVRQGYAHSSTYPPDIKYQHQFTQAQQEASTNNRGLWSSCSTNSDITSAPTTGSNTLSNQSGSCNIKGNISASGEKIYHISGCQSYTKTQIDTSAGERWFCSEQEAVQAGWRKAGNCP